MGAHERRITIVEVPMPLYRVTPIHAEDQGCKVVALDAEAASLAWACRWCSAWDPIIVRVECLDREGEAERFEVSPMLLWRTRTAPPEVCGG